MIPHVTTTEARWIIRRQLLDGIDSVVVIYDDFAARHRFPLRSFAGTTTDDHVLDWIMASDHLRIADEVVTSAGDVLVWQPPRMRVRRLRLGVLVFGAKHVVFE